LLFLMPIGGGIPLGVLMARDSGAAPHFTALLYLASDLLGAITNEPLLWLVVLLGRWWPPLSRLGAHLVRLSMRTGLRDGGARGPLGLIVLTFSTSLLTGRSAAAAAGHGFLSGWTLAIAGDMLYFGLLMVSTLWLSSVLGDQRLTVGLVFGITLIAPLLLRRLRTGRWTDVRIGVGNGSATRVRARVAVTDGSAGAVLSPPPPVDAAGTAAGKSVQRQAGTRAPGASSARRGKRGRRR
jgi:hypothetical protein